MKPPVIPMLDVEGAPLPENICEAIVKIAEFLRPCAASDVPLSRVQFDITIDVNMDNWTRANGMLLRDWRGIS